MSCFEEEGGWSLSFSGAAFLGLYHVGVVHCLQERAPRLLQGARRIYGSSVGALNAICILTGRPVGASGPRRAGGARISQPPRTLIWMDRRGRGRREGCPRARASCPAVRPV